MINSIELESLNEEERKLALQILQEYGEQGNSKTFNDLFYSDYEEIPVDIETFLKDKRYLGNGLIDAEGKFTVFPYWVETLKKIFPNNTETTINTLILTGSIGIGKSLMAVLVQLYLLYRVLCLKDPYLHYGLQPIDTITFSMINVTLDAAKGVGWSKLQELLQSSPWFMSHGKLKGKENLEWQPTKKVELVYGSNNNKLIGRALFCLDGDTEILTTNGVETIKELVDKTVQVVSVNEEGKLVISDDCTIKPTIQTNEEYQIELEDGTIIKCTPNHLLQLVDGSYKAAKDLTEEDELAETQGLNLDRYMEFIDNIIETRGQWNIPDGEYFEAHHIIPKCIGGSGTNRTRGHASKHKNIIWLYPEEHFIAHKLLAVDNSNNKSLVFAWSMMAFPKGKTKRNKELTPDEYAELRKLQSQAISGENNPCYGKVPWNKGKTGVYSEETLQKLRASHHSTKGIPLSEEVKKNMSKAQKQRYIDRPESHPRPTLNKKSITDGKTHRYISKDEVLPEGFTYGQLSRKHYIIKDHEAFSKQKSLQTTGKGNPNYGNGHKVSGGKNGNAIYIYTFEGIDYDCRDALMVELKKRWSEISESTIRRIQNNNYGERTIKKYGYVIENLTWRLKKDED